MNASDWVVCVARLIVILAAGAAVAPLVRRAARRRLTFALMVGGILLALAPTALQLAGTVFSSQSGPGLALLGRLDTPGFALILFGVAVAVHDMCLSRDRLCKQNQVLKKDASTDFLTGLLNRRQAEFLLEYGAARARRAGEPLGFIMMDLDRFKQVNDTHGHQAGDAVLAHVGILLKSRIRTSDILARYGGEEFLVVLPEPTQEDLVALANDLRALIERSPAEHGGNKIPITASFGVALSVGGSDNAENMEAGIGRADAALYAAKALGRNRVVTWEQCTSSDTMPLGMEWPGPEKREPVALWPLPRTSRPRDAARSP